MSKNSYNATIKLIDGFIPNNGDTTFKLMDARNIYYDDTHNLSQDNNHGIIDELETRISQVEETSSDTITLDLLLSDYIRNTTQEVIRNSAGAITGVVHKNGNQIIRTDTFNISSNLITETRVSSEGSLIISTNLSLEGLPTTVTYTSVSS